MKIVYLHQYFNTPDMDGGTRSWSLAVRLVEAGHEVHMVTTDRKAGPTKQKWKWRVTEVDGITVHWTNVRYDNRLSFSRRILAFLQFAARAAERARKLHGDVIFATSTPLTIALPAIYAARFNRRPMVFEVRDLWPDAPITMGALRNPITKTAALWLEKIAYRSSAEVVALAPGMKDGVVRTGYPENQVTVIPNGYDERTIAFDQEAGRRIRAETPWLGDRKMVFYGGVLGLANGVGYLAELAAEVAKRDPEVRFVIVGDGMEWQLVKDRAEQLGVLDESLFMLGQLPKKTLNQWLSAADVTTTLVAPRAEKLVFAQNKFFEALGAGKPVFTNVTGWATDIAQQHNIGRMLPDGDPAAGAAILLEKLADQDWLDAAGQRARAFALSEFSHDQMAKRLETILERTTSSGNPDVSGEPLPSR